MRKSLKKHLLTYLKHVREAYGMKTRWRWNVWDDENWMADMPDGGKTRGMGRRVGIESSVDPIQNDTLQKVA